MSSLPSSTLKFTVFDGDGSSNTPPPIDLEDQLPEDVVKDIMNKAREAEKNMIKSLC